MNSHRIEADIRASDIWRTAQRRRARYLATPIDEPKDDAGYLIAKRSVVAAVLASAVVAVTVWAGA